MHCSSESHCLRVNCLKRNAYLKNRHKIELSTRLGHMFFSQSSIFLSEVSQVLILIKACPVDKLQGEPKITVIFESYPTYYIV
jgi:hypothetical protein